MDTTENGDLEHCHLLSSFHVNGEYSRFSDKGIYHIDSSLKEDQFINIIIINIKKCIFLALKDKDSCSFF